MGDDVGLEEARPEARPSLARRVERTVMDEFAPAHVVVDRSLDVLYFSARTDLFLTVPRGAPNSNLLDMARSGLRPGLRSALHETLDGGRPSRREALPLDDGPVRRTIDLYVQPLPAASDEEALYLVIFAEAPARAAAAGAGDTARDRLAIDDLRQLEDELSLVRKNLRTTVEELQTSNEDLKASNAELLSMNQDLHSSDDDLEAPRELEAVNAALHGKIEELARANSDLKNLLESTRIATVFLDRNFRIKLFTPAARDIFRLGDDDIGRPLTDVVGLPDDLQLTLDARRVLRDLRPVEREVEGADQATFIMRIMPYRTLDDRIDGLVLTFVEVTAMKRAERRISDLNLTLERQLKELETLYDSAPVGLALLDSDLRYVRINAALAAINGVPVEAHLGRSVREVLPDLADRVEPVFHAVLHRGEVCRDVEISGRTPADPDAERTWVSDYYPVVEDGRPRAIGMIVREITELRRSERARRQGDERLRLTLERAPVAVYTCDLDLRYTWEAGAEAQAPFAHAIGRFDHELLPAQQAAELTALKRKALIDGQPVRGELTLPAASGASRTWELAIEPARDGSGAVAGLLMAGLEITERKRAEEQKLLLLGELNHRVKNTLTAVRSMVMRTLAGPEEHEPLRETLVGRLQALARTHDLLAASGWQGAPLTALIEGELAPYRAPGSDRVDADGPAVTLASGAVSILALAVHELTANAARHGALSVPGGRVSLRWQVEPAAGGRGEVLHITWREAGGPPVRESASSGFGRQLIERGVTYEIGGRSETRLDPAGFCWEAWLPVERCLRPEG